MYFRLLHDHASGELTYLLADLHAQEAVLIDPRGRDLPVLQALLATPAHTAGCLSFAWRDRLFCGGLLAMDACPHQPQPALPEALWDCVRQQIFSLPDETLLFSGHVREARAVSAVLEQRGWHPFFEGLSRDEFLSPIAALPQQAAQRSRPTLATSLKTS